MGEDLGSPFSGSRIIAIRHLSLFTCHLLYSPPEVLMAAGLVDSEKRNVTRITLRVSDALRYKYPVTATARDRPG